MIPEFAEHLWQSTIFAVAAALLAVWLRGHRAHVRHGIWLVASVKFLVPFPVLVGLGVRFGLPVQTDTAGVVARGIGQVFALNWNAAPSAAHGVGMGWLLALICGAGFSLRWASAHLRWHQIAAAVRGATRLTVRDGIRIVVSDTLLEPGVFGIWRPVIVMPRGITDRLSPAELEAVIAHEVCHARRRDNLAGAIHMLVESLFWFHPLVWWLGARMVEERERACDEAVLELGGEPQVYAESIVKVCQFYLESPLRCVAGVTGSDLKKRVERIMHKRIGSNLPAWRKIMLTGLGVAAILGPVAVGLFNAPVGRAQGGEGITGVWIGKATGAPPGQEPKTDPLSLNLKQNGSAVTGGLAGARTGIPITNGHIEGDKVTLEVGPQARFELLLSDGRLVGEASLLAKDGSGSFKVRVELARQGESEAVPRP